MSDAISQIRVAVLMTCHNRREKTLVCLNSLHDATAEVGSESNVVVDVFLNDDGSTDGTGEAVKDWSKSITHHLSLITLHLIHGSGSDYWARGMARAWQAALDYEKVIVHSATTTFNYNYFLWLNDDVVLMPNALSALLLLSTANPSAVVIGECCESDDLKKKSYGTDGRWFNGNVVLVPRAVYEKVGMIDGAYAHAKADYDYAERVRRAGYAIAGTPEFVGTCPCDWDNRMRGRSLAQRLHLLFEPCYWNLRDLWLFRCRYYGVIRAVLSCLHLTWLVLRGVK